MNVLEFGAGPTPQWWFFCQEATSSVCVDQRVFPGVTQVRMDLQESWPIRDACFDFVFSAHCLEHCSFAGVLHVLRECRRVMKPDGALRMILPDFSHYAERYLKEGFTEDIRDNVFGQQLYQWDFHLSGWDRDNLPEVLYMAGFKRVWCREGRHPGELAVEARK